MKKCVSCRSGFDGDSWRCPSCGYRPASVGAVLQFAPDLASGGVDDATYDIERISRIQSTHFWYRARAELLAHALRRFFPGSRSFLEIGSGSGDFLVHLASARPGWRLAGSDPVARNSSLAASRLPGSTFYQLDARRIPFVAEFDVIGAFDVLEHIAEDRRVLEQIFAALVPGGGVILTVPQHRFLWGPLDEWSHHKRRYSRADLLAKLEQAGFSLPWTTSFVSFLMPLMWLSRWRDRLFRRSVDPGRELSIGRWPNRAFGVVMASERALIRLGMRLPFGGSLLVVARKPEAEDGTGARPTSADPDPAPVLDNPRPAP